MTSRNTSSRRAFFLQGGAMLGAGMAAAARGVAAPGVDASAPARELQELQRELAAARDREAIRRLHLAFIAAMEQRRYDDAAALFHERGELDLSGVRAHGSHAIRRTLSEQYACQRADVIHCAWRGDARQAGDVVTVAGDGRSATATFHVEAELGRPLRGDSTVEVMARMQGHFADRRWEPGRFDAAYVKARGQWRVASLRWRAV